MRTQDCSLKIIINYKHHIPDCQFSHPKRSINSIPKSSRENDYMINEFYYFGFPKKNHRWCHVLPPLLTEQMHWPTSRISRTMRIQNWAHLYLIPYHSTHKTVSHILRECFQFSVIRQDENMKNEFDDQPVDLLLYATVHMFDKISLIQPIKQLFSHSSLLTVGAVYCIKSDQFYMREVKRRYVSYIASCYYLWGQ